MSIRQKSIDQHLVISNQDVSTSVLYPLGWIIGEVTMALVLYWAHTWIRWFQILFIVIGWAISWVLSMVLGLVVGGFAGAVVTLTSGMPQMGTHSFIVSMMGGLVIAGTLGGLVTVLALRWENPSIEWTEMLIIVIGWSVAWILGRLRN